MSQGGVWTRVVGSCNLEADSRATPPRRHALQTRSPGSHLPGVISESAVVALAGQRFKGSGFLPQPLHPKTSRLCFPTPPPLVLQQVTLRPAEKTPKVHESVRVLPLQALPSPILPLGTQPWGYTLSAWSVQSFPSSSRFENKSKR